MTIFLPLDVKEAETRIVVFVSVSVDGSSKLRHSRALFDLECQCGPTLASKSVQSGCAGA